MSSGNPDVQSDGSREFRYGHCSRTFPAAVAGIERLVAIARFVEQFRLDRRLFQAPEQSRTWDHIRTVFGWEPSSIRLLSENGRRQGACIVKGWGSLRDSFEFICASGVLVGIPPKRRGQK